MTIHAAKGLEFDIVFCAGWEEGVFPSQRALDEGGLASLEEERRLAYVAITRARRKATILHAANRRIYGQWTSSHPQPLRRRAAQGAYRGGNDDDRRREPVARAMVRARRPLRPPRPGPVDARRDPRPRLAARRRGGRFNPEPQRVIEARASAVIARQQGPRPTSRSASACSTASSATARSPRSKATSSRSSSSMRPQEGARQLRQLRHLGGVRPPKCSLKILRPL